VLGSAWPFLRRQNPSCLFLGVKYVKLLAILVSVVSSVLRALKKGGPRESGNVPTPRGVACSWVLHQCGDEKGAFP